MRASIQNMPTMCLGIAFIRFEMSAGGIGIGFIVLTIQLLRLLLIERPKIVITTGSLPCCIALILAKYLFRCEDNVDR